jgi:hypothetical protein
MWDDSPHMKGRCVMFDMKKLRETAMREGMKIMSNPRVMKLMSNPQVMKFMMGAFQLRGNVQSAVDARMKRFAKTFKLATADEVQSLQATIRSLEATLAAVQTKVDANGTSQHA